MTIRIGVTHGPMLWSWIAATYCRVEKGAFKVLEAVRFRRLGGFEALGALTGLGTQEFADVLFARRFYRV